MKKHIIDQVYDHMSRMSPQQNRAYNDVLNGAIIAFAAKVNDARSIGGRIDSELAIDLFDDCLLQSQEHYRSFLYLKSVGARLTPCSVVKLFESSVGSNVFAGR